MSEHRPVWVVLGSVAFFVIAPGIVAGLIPYAITGWHVRNPLLGFQTGRVVGAVLLGLGMASLVESFVRFARRGRGTPAPVAPPTQLVISGQYRHVRNPMYVAILAVAVGQGLLLGNILLLAYAALLWSLFHIWVVVYEEPRLADRFGASYQSYRAHVRRWWPAARPWRG